MTGTKPDTPAAARISTANSAGLKVVIGYKIVKAGIELLIGGAFLALGSAGLAGEFAKFAHAVRHHAAPSWSIALAERIADASTARNIFVIAMAMILDGLLTAVEGWALYRGYAWGRWLVIATTASLLPFEVGTLTRHPSVGRAVILVVNVLIVLYLLRTRAQTRPQSQH